MKNFVENSFVNVKNWKTYLKNYRITANGIQQCVNAKTDSWKFISRTPLKITGRFENLDTTPPSVYCQLLFPKGIELVVMETTKS
jgi:hypothetical protein